MAYARLQEAWHRIRDMPDEEATPENIAEVLERALALREEVADLERRSADAAAELAKRRHVRDRLRQGAAKSQAWD